VETGAERRQRNDEFGGVAEVGVEQSAHALAHSFRELFGCAAHAPRQRQDGKSGGCEHEEVSLGSQEFQANGDRHEDGSQFIATCPVGWRYDRPVRLLACFCL
jgi:hypothetical protein